MNEQLAIAGDFNSDKDSFESEKTGNAASAPLYSGRRNWRRKVYLVCFA
jgi:hypothetical protein